MSRPSRCSLHPSGWVWFGEHPRKPTVRNAWFGSKGETRGGSVMVWAALSWYNILLVPPLPFMAEIVQGSTWKDWVIRYIQWSRRYFGKTMQFSKTTMPPFTELEHLSHYLESMKVNFEILASTVTRSEHHWTTVVRFGDYSKEKIPFSNISKATWKCSSRGMVQNTARYCSKLVRVHSKKDFGCIEGKRWSNVI
jgi:hypothetical protein